MKPTITDADRTAAIRFMVDRPDNVSRQVDDLEARFAAHREAALLVWQPIDTAPRDGTDILVADHEAVTSAFWGVHNPDVSPRLHRYGWVGQVDFAPTHWMPLPKPPLPA